MDRRKFLKELSKTALAAALVLTALVAVKGNSRTRRAAKLVHVDLGDCGGYNVPQHFADELLWMCRLRGMTLSVRRRVSTDLVTA